MPFVSTTADVTDNTSATLTDVPGLTVPVSAGKMYHFRAVLPYTTAATTTGIGVAVDVPNSPTFFEASVNAPISTTAGASAMETDASVTDAEQMTFSATPSTSGSHVVIEGHVKPSVAGEIKIQFNTEVDASAVTVKAGAHMRVTDMGAV